MTYTEAATHFYYKDGDLYRKSTGQVADRIVIRPFYRYKRVAVGNHKFMSSRIVWTLINFAEPTHEIDHKDGDQMNNKIENLRDVPHADNQSNMRRKKRRADLPQGVTKGSACNKYVASMMHRGKYISLGHHDTPEQAHQAYISAKRLHCGDKAPF